MLSVGETALNLRKLAEVLFWGKIHLGKNIESVLKKFVELSAYHN